MKTFLHCNAPVRGDKWQIRQGRNQSQIQILGGLVLFVTLQKQFAENINRSYHVYKVIVLLDIDNKILGIDLTVHSANKNESLILIKF